MHDDFLKLLEAHIIRLFQDQDHRDCCGTAPESIARNAKSAELARSMSRCPC